MLLCAEVQNAVDAGALAATLQLYQDRRKVREAEDAARRFVRPNPVGASMRVAEDLIDVETGYFDSDTKAFQAGAVEPNAVARLPGRIADRFRSPACSGSRPTALVASAIATGSLAEADIMLVLDLSGSMASEGRIKALWISCAAFPGGLDRAILGRRRSDRRDGTRH